MSRRSLIALPGLFIILALLLGAWSSVPGVFAQAPQQAGTPGVGTLVPSGTSQPGTVSISTLTGAPAQVPGLQAAFQKVSAFKLQVNKVKGTNKYDRMFAQDALVTNTEELAVLNYAVSRVTNPDLKNLVQFMIDQHSQDQTQVTQLNQRLNKKSSVDLTNASVFPGTADYDLGIRTENLNALYLDRLTSFSGSSATATPGVSSGSNFDLVALDILLQLHHADLQSEIAAQRLVRSSQMKAFARNGAAMTQMHIKLMEALQDQLFVGIQPAASFETNQGSGGASNPTAVPSVEPSLMPSVMPTSAP